MSRVKATYAGQGYVKVQELELVQSAYFPMESVTLGEIVREEWYEPIQEIKRLLLNDAQIGVAFFWNEQMVAAKFDSLEAQVAGKWTIGDCIWRQANESR